MGPTIGLLLLLAYFAFFIYSVFINPRRCSKHGTNLELANHITGCVECFGESWAEHCRKYEAEQRAAEEEDIRRKARVFAEEFKKAGGL